MPLPSAATTSRALTASMPARLRATCPRATRIASIRALHSTPRRLLPRKDTQDKDSLNPESNEYSKSGSDAGAAATSDAAFNPDKTSPEDEYASAEQESGEVRSSKNPNPLDVSPGNAEISKPRESTEGGAESSAGESKDSSSGRARTSGGGSPNKAGGGKSG